LTLTLPLIIEPAQLAPLLNEPQLLILDLSSEENYLKGHIPGAVHLDPKRLLRGDGPVPNKMPSTEQLSALFSELGLEADTRVVAYDDQLGPWAGRLIWTLHCVGHRHASLLNGQLAAWIAAGETLEQTPRQAQPKPFVAQVDTSLVADADWLNSHLKAPELQIWDARSPEEYDGSKVVNALHGGHIPGAVNFEWTRALEQGTVPRLRDAASLRAELAAAGIDGNATIVTHCQTHRRSGLTYVVGKWLGFADMRCYDGSWFEWGNRPELPVER